jgi:hypothetical protein
MDDRRGNRDAQADRIITAFEAWLDKYDIPNGSAVVMRGGKVIGQ